MLRNYDGRDYMIGYLVRCIMAELERAGYNPEQNKSRRRAIEIQEQYRKNTMKTDTWIKMSERKPVEQDLPIIAGSYRHGEWSCSSVWDRVDGPDTDRTHWMSIPPAPIKEPTQKELDNKAFVEKYGEFSFTTTWQEKKDSWEKSLRYERTAIHTLLQRFDNHQMSEKELIERIRGRVG